MPKKSLSKCVYLPLPACLLQLVGMPLNALDPYISSDHECDLRFTIAVLTCDRCRLDQSFTGDVK